MPAYIHKKKSGNFADNRVMSVLSQATQNSKNFIKTNPSNLIMNTYLTSNNSNNLINNQQNIAIVFD